jgi:hypothetical protein
VQSVQERAKIQATSMEKSPLYRKVNTTAHGVHHRSGGDYSDHRSSKRSAESEGVRSKMHGRKRRGLDYTPLFRFLLSKVGEDWNTVYSEAISRLDRPDPIFWLVALNDEDAQAYVGTGESSYFSGLRVDENLLLQIVDKTMGPHSLPPECKCCTHTFNGARFTRPFDPEAVLRAAVRRWA